MAKRSWVRVTSVPSVTSLKVTVTRVSSVGSRLLAHVKESEIVGVDFDVAAGDHDTAVDVRFGVGAIAGPAF